MRLTVVTIAKTDKQIPLTVRIQKITLTNFRKKSILFACLVALATKVPIAPVPPIKDKASFPHSLHHFLARGGEQFFRLFVEATWSPVRVKKSTLS